MDFFSFAQENGLIFLETSAKTGDSVEEAFLKCSKTILAKIETGELDPERIGSGILFLVLFERASFYLYFIMSQASNMASRCFEGINKRIQDVCRIATI